MAVEPTMTKDGQQRLKKRVSNGCHISIQRVFNGYPLKTRSVAVGGFLEDGRSVLQSSASVLLDTISRFGLIIAVNNKSGRHCNKTLVFDGMYMYYVFGLSIMGTIMSINR